MIVWISKKIMSVVYDIIKDDLSELLSQELNDDGYNGIEVKVTLTRVEIIMLATRTQNVLGTQLLVTTIGGFKDRKPSPLRASGTGLKTMIFSSQADLDAKVGTEVLSLCCLFVTVTSKLKAYE
ncbi:40S ribosomal protein S3 [Lemmus lemmus]